MALSYLTLNVYYYTPPLGYEMCVFFGVRWVRLGYIGGWGRAPAARQARGPSAAARQARGPSAAARQAREPGAAAIIQFLEKKNTPSCT